jgi:hypothetical protein
MKKIILGAFLSLAFVACNESASSKIDKSKPKKPTEISLDQVDTTSDAKMEFDAKDWNFGEIMQGESVEHAFTFTNTGSEPLIISNAKGSCGCTVPVWPREPVAPGESGVIDVKFNSKGKKGKQSKKVTLTTNMVPSQMILMVNGMVNLKEE